MSSAGRHDLSYKSRSLQDNLPRQTTWTPHAQLFSAQSSSFWPHCTHFICVPAATDFHSRRVLLSYLSWAIYLTYRPLFNGNRTRDGASNTVRHVLVFSEPLALTAPDSDIIHLNLAGTPVIVLSSLEATDALFEKRSSLYSDR
jgi:hypothetical protein